MKNNNAKKVAIYVILGLIGVASLTCIILSMVTGEVTPFLGTGLGLAGFGNMIGLATVYKKRGNDNGSCEDGRIS